MILNTGCHGHILTVGVDSTKIRTFYKMDGYAERSTDFIVKEWVYS